MFVSHRLAFFEVKHQFYSKEKLTWVAARHYTEQVKLQPPCVPCFIQVVIYLQANKGVIKWSSGKDIAD